MLMGEASVTAHARVRIQSSTSFSFRVQPGQQRTGFLQQEAQCDLCRNNMPTPTVVPYPDFDDEADAQALRTAFKGFGTDEDAVIDIICRRSNEQRLQIASRFKTMYGKDLIKELKSELRGNFEDVILALMTDPIEFQAKQLHKAISGLGTEESTIVEILATNENETIRRIAQEYEGLYQTSLESDIRGDTSGTVKKLLVSLSTGNRDDSGIVDPEKARRDAQELLQAGELLFAGTDESVFNMVMCQRNKEQLKLIFEMYEEITGHPFEKAIENEFSGTAKDSLLELVHAVRDPIDYLATRLHDSMAGIGTDDRTLIRITVTRSEIDLGDIKEVYLEKYGKTLAERMDQDTSGDYKKALLAIVG